MSDVHAAWRGLRASPGLAATAVITLALGIGLDVAVFTVANATLFKGYRGVPDPSGLVYLTTSRDCCVSAQDVMDWRAATTLNGLGGVADLRVALQLTAGAAQTATATQILPETFGVLRVSPALGRDFSPADAGPGAPPVAILSHEFWQTAFGGDAGALGRTLRVNGVVTTIVGVMPPQFAFPQYQELWVPFVPTPTLLTRDARALWFAVARLADGRSMDDARAELETIGTRLAKTYPVTNARITPIVQTFRELFYGASALGTYSALLGAVGLVLLIACANLANLLLTRAALRTRDIAMRMALGAGRRRIVRQLLCESALIGLAGGTLGAWIADVAVRLYEAVAAPPTQPWARQMLDYSRDGRVLAYLVLVSTLATLVCGLLPALRLGRLDLNTALKDGGRSVLGRRGERHLTAGMVTAQVGVAVVVLSAAGVLVRSFFVVRDRDAGFDPTRVAIAIPATLPSDRYPDETARRRFYDQLVARLEALPDVEAIGFSDGLVGQSARRLAVDIDGQSRTDDRSTPTARVAVVGGNYFGALGVTMWSGRRLNESDETSTEAVAVISRGLAAALWPTADPVGRRLRVRPQRGDPGPWRTVVGIAPDVRQGDIASADIDPMVYLPLRERPARGAWVLVRTTRPADTLIAPMRRELQATDPSLPIWLGPFTLADWIGGNNWRRGVFSGLFALFATMAVLQAGLGLFAVVASSVARRSQEIGVRVALGARSGSVLWVVSQQAFGPVALGLGVGLLGAVTTNRLLGAQLVQISPSDPTTLVIVVVTLIAVAVLGIIIPARRALRVDPLVALRLD
ncbi:MAG: ABC transporter permease [Vicinamibacterales bacterium]